MNDPGRAVAWSRDGTTWQRSNPGQEIDLGVFPDASGTIEFWLDNCYRDSVSVGPAYFDYVRLYPTEDPAAAERLFEAARWKAATLTKGSADERTVNVTVSASFFRTRSQLACSLWSSRFRKASWPRQITSPYETPMEKRFQANVAPWPAGQTAA